jgi:hypothetical protein
MAPGLKNQDGETKNKSGGFHSCSWECEGGNSRTGVDKLKTVPEAGMSKRKAIAMLNPMKRCE